MMIELHYTPKESLQLLQEVHPTNWLQQMTEHIIIITGVAKTQKRSLNEAYKICRKFAKSMNENIRFHAAIHHLTNSNFIANRLIQIDEELQQLANRSAHIENDKEITLIEKSYTREAIYKRSKHIQLEQKQLQYAQSSISNIPFKATIVKPNGSEEEI